MSDAETCQITEYHNAAIINRSRYFVGPDLTHWTSWLHSTSEFTEQQMTVICIPPPNRGKCYPAPDKQKIMLFSSGLCIPGNQTESAAHPTQPACGNADKRFCPLVALWGATCLS